MEQKQKTEQFDPQELRKEIKKLRLVRVVFCCVGLILSIPVAAGILGGVMGGIFLIFYLIDKNALFLAIGMGIVGGIGGTVLACYIVRDVYLGMGEDIQKKSDLLNQSKSEESLTR